jgi:hypothetical protein
MEAHLENTEKYSRVPGRPNTNKPPHVLKHIFSRYDNLGFETKSEDLRPKGESSTEALLASNSKYCIFL